MESILDQSDELAIARAVSAQLVERGSFEQSDCIMLIGSTVVDFGHARSDLDLLVSGGSSGRLPLHMFHEGRRVDVDFLSPETWSRTRGWVNACAISTTQSFEGELPPAVDERDWWADHLWLYDRVVHGVPITERTAADFLRGTSRETLAAAIGNYSRALCDRMMQRARMHLDVNNVEAACQYGCEAILAAIEAVAADRGVTFWSDRTILEKAKRVQVPDDSWDSNHIEKLFCDLVHRAWGAGVDRSNEVSAVVATLLGPLHAGQVNAADGDAMTIGNLVISLADGWTAQVASGEGFLLAPDHSLYSVSPAVARFLVDRGDVPTLGWPVAAILAATGAVLLEPTGASRPSIQRSPGLALRDVCLTPVAPSPGSWLSSRIAAQWYAMTVWSLSDDLKGAVESKQRNRIMPILRKAELFLRMLTIAAKGCRSEVTRNLAMDLQGCSLSDNFQALVELVYSDHIEQFKRIPELAVTTFAAVMEDCGIPARADMFERSRSFMKQLGDVRMWFRVSTGLGIPIQVPSTLAAKGAVVDGSANSSIFIDQS